MISSSPSDQGASKNPRPDSMMNGWMDFEGCATEMKYGFLHLCDRNERIFAPLRQKGTLDAGIFAPL